MHKTHAEKRFKNKKHVREYFKKDKNNSKSNLLPRIQEVLKNKKSTD